MNIEKRLLSINVAEDNNKMMIEGYAVVYEETASHMMEDITFTEVIKRGALDKTDLHDVVLRYNHNDTWCIMARTKNNSLQLIKDDKGLKIQAILIDTQSNRDIYKAIQEGLLDKMSFSFSVAKNGDNWDISKEKISREITQIDKLYDVSIVDMPFYEATNVYARRKEPFQDWLKKKQTLEFRKRKLLSISEGSRQTWI